MEDAQTNPIVYHIPPTYKHVNSLGSTTLEMQRNPKSGNEAFSIVILREVTEYVGTIITSIYKKYKTLHLAVKSENF